MLVHARVIAPTAWHSQKSGSTTGNRRSILFQRQRTADASGGCSRRPKPGPLLSHIRLLGGSNPEHHEYELYLALEDIDHTRTKTQSPQTNGICERFHKTVLNEFYRVTFRKKLYKTIEELQSDLDQWLKVYNEERIHQGRWCYSKTPMQTFIDTVPLAKEKCWRREWRFDND